MNLYEFQGRELLDKYGVTVPVWTVVETADGARDAAAELACQAVVKAQVLTGGRGKAGGVKLVDSPEAAAQAAEKILSLTIKGHPVKRLIVARAVDIEKEYYLSLTVDRVGGSVIMIFSSSGGVDIEEVAAKSPQSIRTIPFQTLDEVLNADLGAVFGDAFPSDAITEQAGRVLHNIARLMWEQDCGLVEINPLVLTDDGKIVAADAKITLDDNALPRHPELEKYRNEEEYSADEMEAKAAGLSFVSLDGEIGCMVNGAGLAMATMDCIKLFGGTPANFLDVGGSSNPDKVLTGLKILLRNPRTRVILINIFGGITRCNDIARGILIAREQLDIPVPVVIRLTGTNEEEGRALLKDAGLAVASEMVEAVEKAVRCLQKEAE